MIKSKQPFITETITLFQPKKVSRESNQAQLDTYILEYKCSAPK